MTQASKAQEAEAKGLAFNAHQYTNILAVIVARDEAIERAEAWKAQAEKQTKLKWHLRVRLDKALAMLKELREDVTPAYKAGRIPAESFVRAGNLIDTIERGK